MHCSDCSMQIEACICDAFSGRIRPKQGPRNLDDSDASYPGMAAAFERHFGQSWTDRDWRGEASTWAAAWKAAIMNRSAQRRTCYAGTNKREQ